MPSPSLSSRLSHMLDAIAQIETQTAGLSFEEFAEDRFRQLGIERCLEIVSEASRHIPDDVKARHAVIPWRRVGDIGNRLRHAYQAVDSAMIWEISTRELSELQLTVERIMRDSETEP